MRLKHFHIQNFRGITELSLDLDKTTVLVGENNAGKTTVLEALHACLGRRLTGRSSPFNELDFHLDSDGADPSSAPPITLTLTFEEEAEDEWPVPVVQILDKAVQILDDDRRRVSLRITTEWDTATRDIKTSWNFLNKDGKELPGARNPRNLNDLQLLAPVFYLPALRDAAQSFGARSPFWAPFTRSLSIDDKVRMEIEEQIAEINQSILDSHAPFGEVKDRIERAASLLPLGDAKDLVSIDALPARVLEMVSKTEVKLACRTGARLPLARHGAGTQSISVLFLFEAFLRSQLAAAYDEQAEPLVALEEPEAHLHPSAIRALWSVLDGLAGQSIIATHSGDLLANAPLESLRRFVRENGVVKVFQVCPGTLSDREAQKVRYHVRLKRGALFFARCWLLVEGETDFVMIPEFARMSDIDFDQEGVVCLEFSQCGLEPLVKLAQALGIEWHLLADGDPAGNGYVTEAKELLDGAPERDRISQLTDRDIEHACWNCGYDRVYESAVTGNRRRRLQSAVGDASYPSEVIKAAQKASSKPALAYGVLLEADKDGSPGVPAEIKAAIDQAVALARRHA